MRKIRTFALALSLVAVFVLANSCAVDNGPVEKSILSFNSEAELMNTLNEIKTMPESRNNLEKLQGFHSMLDVFEKIESLENETALQKHAGAYSKFIVISSVTNENGEVNRMINMKVNFLFASLVNTNGEVMVNGLVYNLLKEEDTIRLNSIMIDYYSKQNQVNPQGIYVTIPDCLPTAVPMYAAYCIPITYPCIYFKTTIGGRSVIVQVWKGYLPTIWGIDGGIGAEVGLYYPLWWTKDLWMPDYKHCQNISYNMVLKSTGRVVVSASNYTWWLNKWLKFEILPITASSYRLDYTIAGVSRSW